MTDDGPVPRGRFSLGKSLAAAVLLVTLFAAFPGDAAGLQLAARGDLPQSTRALSGQSDPLVARIQKALSHSGLYEGPIDGLMGPKTDAAIRAYQKRIGVKVDGLVSEELASHIETGDKVDDLLRKLEKTREANTKAARQALMNNPATRDLVSEELDEVADPTRDVSSCLRNPTIPCMLSESSESAKAVPKDELRDWALGELLSAQARAGLADAAMDTARRIGDPRLVMVALRDIAEAQAESGRTEDALEAAGIIPDSERQAEAFAAIAQVQTKTDPALVPATLDHFDTAVSRIDKPLRKVTLLCKAATILNAVDSDTLAQKRLADAEALARGIESRVDRDAGLRAVASAYAEMGNPNGAVAILGEIKNGGDHTPVLVAAAKAQAAAGNPHRALKTADAIEASRYKAIVLSRIAQAQARGGDPAAALATLERAIESAESIKLPFAKDFAFGQIATAYAHVAMFSGRETFHTAVATANRLGDTQLKARILWAVAAEQMRAGDRDGAAETRMTAREATAAIKSPLSRVWMYGDIAIHHATEKEEGAAWNAFADGLKEAAGIDNAWARSRAFSRMAVTLIELTAMPSLADAIPE